MRLTHLKPKDYKRMPWKNGGGMTTEIIVEQDQGGNTLWRLSIAEVEQSGPFSDFSGYDRSIMLIEGAGFTLAFDEAPQRRIDQPFEPFRFDGGWRAACTLIDGAIRDFNLMAARKGPAAELTVERPGPGSVEVAAARTVVFHALKGDAAVSGHGIGEGETLRVDMPIFPLSLEAPEPATIAVIRIG
ncbi:MAG TPA: HutD family protein [Candidatus Cybelea sp.]|nr:HutD family protein [Candidatus Cybelea sp.]